MRTLALLGGMGSGKSVGTSLRFRRHCVLNGKDRRRKGAVLKTPKAAIVAPTWKLLDGPTRDTFESVFPPGWIKKRKGQPRPYVELKNGVVVELHSSETLESSSYFAILVEEIQHKAYGDRQWGNFSARVRDKDAVTLTETYNGLPQEGRVRARFDKEPTPAAFDDAGERVEGGSWTILVSTHDNTLLPPEVLGAILASVPASEAEKLIHGRWMQPIGAVFPGYDSAVHVRKDAFGDPSVPVHIGIDPGPLGSVVFGQVHTVRALLPEAFTKNAMAARERGYDDLALRIVGQLTPEQKEIDGICEEILARKPAWPIVPGVTKIFHDPTLSYGDLKILQSYFRGCRILPAEQYNGAAEDRVTGTNRALRDAIGTVRLTFSPALAGAKRGVLDCMSSDARHETSGELKQDNWYEHARDALGYLIEGIMPIPYKRANLPSMKHRVLGRR